MKPDWKGAPKWANYLAMDGTGKWFWHEKEPVLVADRVWAQGGLVAFAVIPVTDFRQSLEPRP